MNKYPNSGALHYKQAINNQPNFKGKIDLGEDLIDYIIQEHRAGKDVSLDLSAWTKTSAAGNEYISLSVQKAWVPDPEYKNKPKPTSKSTSGSIAEMDNDIPF